MSYQLGGYTRVGKTQFNYKKVIVDSSKHFSGGNFGERVSMPYRLGYYSSRGSMKKLGRITKSLQKTEH